MKLETTILPRRDGTVRVSIGDADYTFSPDASGALVADVPNDEHVAQLIHLGDFLPADEADFERAAKMTGSASTGDGADDSDDEDEDVDPNAAPIEEPASAVAAKPQKPVAARKKK